MLKVFFSEVNWRNMKDLGEVQQAYYFLLNKYKMKVKKYVPIQKVNEERKIIGVTEREMQEERKKKVKHQEKEGQQHRKQGIRISQQ